MKHHNQHWMNQLGVDPEQLSAKPEGADALVWCLENNIIDQENYSRWASSYFQLPQIKPQFFTEAADTSLVKKYEAEFPWTPFCYPVYQWGETLYVACLQPQNIPSELNACYLIAPYEALIDLWQKQSAPVVSSAPEVPPETAQVQPTDLPDFPEITQTQDVKVPPENSQPLSASKEQESSIQNEDHDSESEVSEEVVKPEVASLDDLDFSSLENQTRAYEMPDEDENLEAEEPITQTAIDPNINNATSATQTMHASPVTESLDPERFPDLSGEGPAKQDFVLINEDNPKTEQQVEKKPVAPNIFDQGAGTELPSLDELVAKKQEDATPVDPTPEVDTRPSSNDPTMDDDLTPMPFITESEMQEKGIPGAELTKPDTRGELTITDGSQPVEIPDSNLISEQDLSAAANLEACHGTKSVMAYMFHHLKNDYNKLMWIEMTSDGQFLPKYVYGTWRTTALAWTVPINLTQPNIFRIAYNSSLPFHGEISVNELNQKYFDLWTQGKNPNASTIFPLCYEDQCYGFLVGFSQGDQYDDVASLKKVENLVSIVREKFLQSSSSQAA